VSFAGLLGGGNPTRPGEASLAHHGVLFLDELPEFRRSSLEVLRQPLEEGFVTVSRHRGTVRLPARFQLIGAMNPCPCGLRGSAKACRCTAAEARAYVARLSGPLLDRIDLHVPVPPVGFDELAGPSSEATSRVRERILAAIERQARRLDGPEFLPNALLPPRTLRALAWPGQDGERLLRRAMDRGGLTARGYDRLLRVARTIADLADREEVRAGDLAEALQFRRSPIDWIGSDHSNLLESPC
jgi:magnesium chelatase family protein